jgi:signal transduction histidine kinase
MERRIKEFNVLSGIGKSVTTLLEQDRLLARIVEAAVYITAAEEGFLFLADRESGELWMRAGCGLGERHARSLRLKVEDNLAAQVLRTGQPIALPGAHQKAPPEARGGRSFKSILLVPLKAGETVIGVLSVDRMREERAFGDHHMYMLSALAEYAAIALENARLYAQLQRRLEEVSEGIALTPSATLAERVPPAGPAPSPNLGRGEERIQAFVAEGQARLASLREQLSRLESWLQEAGAWPEQAAAASPALASALAGLACGVGDILDGIVDGILVIDQGGQVAMANRVAQRMLGGELVGAPAGDVCDDPRWAKTYRLIQTAARRPPNTPGSELTSASTLLSVADKMLRAAFRAVFSGAQELVAVVAVLQDVGAERKERQAKDSFVTSISQELRTPITSIMGYADLLVGESVGSLSKTQRKFLGRIQANARRISGLLGDLEGMTIIENQELGIKVEAVDIAGVVRQAYDALRPQMVEKGQDLDLDLQPALPPVRADPDAVYHILASLLRNAHYCSPQGAHVRLEARRVLDGENEFVLVAVTDAGEGVSSRDRKRVFSRFYRADNATVPGLGDSGLGLSIVKVLVEAQGGRIWLDSEPGAGSTFTFILPVHR